MMRKQFLAAISFMLGLAMTAGVASAQSPTVQKAFEGVKTRLDDLVTAKDENAASDLALRIDTYKKVIVFSLAEAKDLKIKLLAADQLKDKQLVSWKERMISELNRALSYYQAEQQYLDDRERAIDLAALQMRAEGFKAYRETNFLPAAKQVQDFLLLQNEEKAIAVAERRLEKITNDIQGLERAKFKNVAELKTLLAEAARSIAESKEIYKTAYDAFFAVIAPQTSETATSTPALNASTIATSSLALPATSTTSSNATTSATSSTPQEGTLATSTAAEGAAVSQPPPSIKDLIRDSLGKIQEAYRAFIEMSNLVRKLLV